MDIQNYSEHAQNVSKTLSPIPSKQLLLWQFQQHIENYKNSIKLMLAGRKGYKIENVKIIKRYKNSVYTNVRIFIVELSILHYKSVCWGFDSDKTPRSSTHTYKSISIHISISVCVQITYFFEWDYDVVTWITHTEMDKQNMNSTHSRLHPLATDVHTVDYIHSVLMYTQ